VRLVNKTIDALHASAAFRSKAIWKCSCLSFRQVVFANRDSSRSFILQIKRRALIEQPNCRRRSLCRSQFHGSISALILAISATFAIISTASFRACNNYGTTQHPDTVVRCRKRYSIQLKTEFKAHHRGDVAITCFVELIRQGKSREFCEVSPAASQAEERC
jgi:hypothetical protein